MNNNIKYLIESFIDDEEELNDINIALNNNLLYIHVTNVLELKETPDTKLVSKCYLNGMTYMVKNKEDLRKIIGIFEMSQYNWLDVSQITDMSGLFKDDLLFNSDISKWDVSNVVNMSCMFEGTYEFNLDISKWDVSNVTDISFMFHETGFFLCDISNWDVSNVTTMEGMFKYAASFNCPIGKWNVSNVKNMGHMFYYAWVFNTPLDNWDVSNVVNMSHMFYGAEVFNQPISKWDVSNVTNMRAMFTKAHVFNLDLTDWNTINVNNVEHMFYGTAITKKPNWYYIKILSKPTVNESFLDNETEKVDIDILLHSFSEFQLYINSILNGKTELSLEKIREYYKLGESYIVYDKKDILQVIQTIKMEHYNWIDTSRITDMSELFSRNNTFNSDISKWDVSNVTNMSKMFYCARTFNSPIGDWDVSSVTDMSYMFSAAFQFNQNIGDWNVSNVTNMDAMFSNALNFNLNINSWDVSNVTNMRFMFNDCRDFNSPLDEWNVSNVTDMSGMFFNALSFNKYIGNWDVSNVTDMDSMFCNARKFCLDLDEWNIENATQIEEMFEGSGLENYPPKWYIDAWGLNESFIDDEEELNDIELSDGGRIKRYLESERQKIMSLFCRKSCCFADDKTSSLTTKIRQREDNEYEGIIIEYYEDLSEYNYLTPDITFIFHENSKNIKAIYINEYDEYKGIILTDFIQIYQLLFDLYGITIDKIVFSTKNVIELEKTKIIKCSEDPKYNGIVTIDSNLIKKLPIFARCCVGRIKGFNAIKIAKIKFDSFDTLYNMCLEFHSRKMYVHLLLDDIYIKGKKLNMWDKILTQELIDYLMNLNDLTGDPILTVKIFRPM